MIERKIVIATDFSTEVHGRYRKDHEFNGTRFRNQVLLPALRGADKVSVDLNGLSYGSSFLDEAFAGLVLYGYYDERTLRQKLSWEHKLQSTRDRIDQYLREAEYRSKHSLAGEREADYPIPN